MQIFKIIIARRELFDNTNNKFSNKRKSGKNQLNTIKKSASCKGDKIWKGEIYLKKRLYLNYFLLKWQHLKE